MVLSMAVPLPCTAWLAAPPHRYRAVAGSLRAVVLGTLLVTGGLARSRGPSPASAPDASGDAAAVYNCADVVGLAGNLCPRTPLQGRSQQAINVACDYEMFYMKFLPNGQKLLEKVRALLLAPRRRTRLHPLATLSAGSLADPGIVVSHISCLPAIYLSWRTRRAWTRCTQPTRLSVPTPP